ncbi:MAG: 50S ribosomal protein L6 [Gammaproteobacteria bacterium]|jgi:large subunit ribosomal protein L6|nr:50S ribosomal protein L6 [Gammaproteobacteria bacterium]
MSRIANAPVELPSGVQVNIADGLVSVKGSNGSLDLQLHELVDIVNEDNQLKLSAKEESKEAVAMTGTFRSLVNNMVTGVSDGFEKKLELQGVGYRAKAQGKTLNLVLGFSHPIDYSLPEGVTAETPSQTEIVIKGPDKQLVGQVAAEIRKFRPPEPYKGKGVRYADERVFRKEAKKK